MIKLWQKATLSILASTGLYSCFLTQLTKQTGAFNIQKHNIKLQSEERQQSLNLINTQRQQAGQLKKQLQSIKNQSAKLQKEISQTKVEIQKIKAGESVNPVHITSVASPKSTPKSVIQPVQHSVTPPLVQAVSKASGY